MNPDQRMTVTQALKHPYFNTGPLIKEPKEIFNHMDLADCHEYSLRRGNGKLNKKIFTFKHNKLQPSL